MWAAGPPNAVVPSLRNRRASSESGVPDEIRAAAPEIGWEEPAGIAYEPLGRGWTLSRDVSVNYMMAGVRREAR